MDNLKLAMDVLNKCNVIEHYIAEYDAAVSDPTYRKACHAVIGDEWVAMVALFLQLNGEIDRATILPLVAHTNKTRDKVVAVLNLTMP